MRQKLKWYFIGFITAIAAISTCGWIINRPSNSVREFSPEIQEFMLQSMPWLKSARGANLGPFTILVSSKKSEKPEAIIWAKDKGFPQIILSENDISLIDSKYRMMTIKINDRSGELESYYIAPDLLNGSNYFDNDFDGQYDVKFIVIESGQRPEISIYYKTKWLPVVFKDKKKYIEVAGALKEIRLEEYVWKFVE